jgi:hypothetical protein
MTVCANEPVDRQDAVPWLQKIVPMRSIPILHKPSVNGINYEVGAVRRHLNSQRVLWLSLAEHDLELTRRMQGMRSSHVTTVSLRRVRKSRKDNINLIISC